MPVFAIKDELHSLKMSERSVAADHGLEQPFIFHPKLVCQSTETLNPGSLKLSTEALLDYAVKVSELRKRLAEAAILSYQSSKGVRIQIDALDKEVPESFRRCYSR